MDADKGSESHAKLDDNVDKGSRPTSAEMRLAKSKRIVNIYQFYPEIKIKPEDYQHSATLIDCINEEDSEEEEDSRAESALTDVTGESPDRKEDVPTPVFRSILGIWSLPIAMSNSRSGSDLEGQPDKSGVFSTAVDDDIIESAKGRLSGQTLEPETWSPNKPTETMRMVINKKVNEHFDNANNYAKVQQYEKGIICLNKAIKLRTDIIDCYIMRAELYLQLCDYQSSILNYKRVRSIDPENDDYHARLAFIYYLQGQCLFDQRLFPEALESFAYAAEMRPFEVGYSMRSIACLAALNRHGECLALVNKRLETEQDNPDLFLLRARLHNMFRNFTLCFYDVKDALTLNPEHPEAVKMMQNLERKAEDAKTGALQLNVTRKYRDSLQKISLAIETNPSIAEYHNLRGAVHRHLNDFNSAIDDYLLALDKTDHDEENPIYRDSQRQLLLTYNDFAVECFRKGYFDEAIILLNKAIKGEKSEKGFYLNRGDCFFKQNEVAFAMADYHQALELDFSDQNVKDRISIVHNEHGLNAYHDKKYVDAESHFTLAIRNNPLKSQYFVSRAKTRYMMENSSGARQDILIGMQLNPTGDDIISLMTQLFPGKSMNDIVQSRAADTARQTLQELVSAVMPNKMIPILQPKTMSTKNKEKTVDISSSARFCWNQSYPGIRQCMQEYEFDIKTVEEKNLINSKVKKKLLVRESLNYKGGRVTFLPPQPEKQQVKPGAAVTGWKQYSLGIGVPTKLDV